MEGKGHSPVAQMLITFGYALDCIACIVLHVRSSITICPFSRYMGIWICLSALVIMINKYILDPKMGAFPFPLALTSIHMAFCSLLSWMLIKLGYVTEVAMPMSTYVR
jgi:hypothetical protein